MQEPSRNPKKPRSPLQGFMPFFWLSLTSAVGVLAADIFRLPVWVWALLACLGLLVGLLICFLPKSLSLKYFLKRWTRSDQRLPGLVVAVVFFVSGWRMTAVQPLITPFHAAYYNDRGVVQVVGRIVEPPDDRDTVTNLTVQVESLLPLTDGQHGMPVEGMSGMVLMQVPPGNNWAYGYRVRFTGLLRTPLEGADFSYRDYLARKGILSIMTHPRLDWIEFSQGNVIKTFIFNMRAQGYSILHRLFPPPESDLLAGILLGIDQGLSPGLQKAFQRTGTTHIIAISGFNIAILGGLFSGVSTRLMGRKWGTLIAVAGIAGYTLLVGGDAAVVRAAIMGSVGVLGGMFGRRQNGLNSMGLAAVLMILVDPNLLWDVGFQLSVAATLGLVLYGQPLEERFIRTAAAWISEDQAQKLAGPISEFFLFTIAAQIMTLPIMAYHFGGVSWLALFANPLILPPQSFVMVLGGLTLLSGLVLPGLGKVMAMITMPFVSYTIRMVSWLAQLPGGELLLPDFHYLWLVICYAGLFLITLVPREDQRKLYTRVFSYQTTQLFLAGLVFFVWSRVLSAPDGRLHLTLLDSEGTILIQTPSGSNVLIGGGSRPSHLNQAIGEMLPKGKQHLDLLIVGSTAREDLNALTGSLKITDVGMALWGIDPDTNQASSTVFSLLAEKRVPWHTMTSGQSLDLGDDIHIEVLWAGRRGAVLWLEWGNFSALIPTGKVEDHYSKAPGSPDVLLLGDGFSSEALPLWQMNLWSPSVVLLPLEEADIPLQGEHALMTLLADYPVISPLNHGWVRVSTDGDRLWVNTER